MRGNLRLRDEMNDFGGRIPLTLLNRFLARLFAPVRTLVLTSGHGPICPTVLRWCLRLFECRRAEARRKISASGNWRGRRHGGCGLTSDCQAIHHRQHRQLSFIKIPVPRSTTFRQHRLRLTPERRSHVGTMAWARTADRRVGKRLQ